MKKLILLCSLATLCWFTSCEKTSDLTEIQVNSALDYALQYANALQAERVANHIDTYLNNSSNPAFINTIQETNEYMELSGFNHFDRSEVFTSQNENILFYPILRDSEAGRGFLNLCMPFFRENFSTEPILLLEGPGTVGLGMIAEELSDRGESIEDNGVPLTVDVPGQGSFEMGYWTSFFTKNGHVEIDFDVENPYMDKEGTLNVKVTSSEETANFEKSWLIKF